MYIIGRVAVNEMFSLMMSTPPSINVYGVWQEERKRRACLFLTFSKIKLLYFSKIEDNRGRLRRRRRHRT